MPPEIWPGQLALGPGQTDQFELVPHDAPDLGLGAAGVLAQREGHVVVDGHRAEQRAVLEQHPEQLAHLVELPLRQPGQVLAGDPDRAAVGPDQTDQGLEEDRLAGAGRTEEHGDLAGRQREADARPDRL
jgi:hypothetical protein